MVCLEWDSYLEFSSQEAAPLLAFRPERAGFKGRHQLGACWCFWVFLGCPVSSSQSGRQGEQIAYGLTSGLLLCPHICASFPLPSRVFL